MERSGGRQKEGSKAGRRGKKEGEEGKGDEAALTLHLCMQVSTPPPPSAAPPTNNHRVPLKLYSESQAEFGPWTEVSRLLI